MTDPFDLPDAQQAGDTAEPTGYEYWLNALEGLTQEIHQNEPQPGFYRNKHGTPCAIWVAENGEPTILLGDKVVEDRDHEDVWTRVCTRPVTEDEYNAVMAGGVWSDMDPAIADTLGDNIRNASDPEGIKALIQILENAASLYAASIESDSEASKAQSLRSRALELKARADKIRVAEKEPHLAAGRAVDQTWQPLVKAADAVVAKLRKSMEAFETKKMQERRRAEEAERARRQAEFDAKIEAAREAGGSVDVDMSGPDQPEPEPLVKSGIRGGYGRAAGVSYRNVVVSIDRLAAFHHFFDHPSLTELLMKLAQAEIDRGNSVPGAKVEEQAIVR
jgi:hypothetical protein